MSKDQSKKGQNYIPFLESTYPEMQRKHPNARAAREPPAPGGQGSSGRTPEQRLHIDRVLVDIYNQTSTRYSFG